MSTCHAEVSKCLEHVCKTCQNEIVLMLILFLFIKKTLTCPLPRRVFTNKTCTFSRKTKQEFRNIAAGFPIIPQGPKFEVRDRGEEFLVEGEGDVDAGVHARPQGLRARANHL